MIFSIVILYLLSQEQSTPLHIACENGKRDVVSVLLAHNANVEARDEVSVFLVLKIILFISFLILYFLIGSSYSLTSCL